MLVLGHRWLNRAFKVALAMKVVAAAIGVAPALSWFENIISRF